MGSAHSINLKDPRSPAFHRTPVRKAKKHSNNNNKINNNESVNCSYDPRSPRLDRTPTSEIEKERLKLLLDPRSPLPARTPIRGSIKDCSPISTPLSSSPNHTTSHPTQKPDDLLNSNEIEATTAKSNIISSPICKEQQQVTAPDVDQFSTSTHDPIEHEDNDFSGMNFIVLPDFHPSPKPKARNSSNNKAIPLHSSTNQIDHASTTNISPNTSRKRTNNHLKDSIIPNSMLSLQQNNSGLSPEVSRNKKRIATSLNDTHYDKENIEQLPSPKLIKYNNDRSPALTRKKASNNHHSPISSPLKMRQ